MTSIKNAISPLILIVSFFLAAFTEPFPQTLPSTEEVAVIIEKYRELIHEQMRKQGITGFAVTLVTDEEVLWSEGFGCTDRTCQTPVSEDTPFGIGSISKSMTATAILLAVEDGLVDLDQPISTYLPDFTVNSIFDDRPQDMITLRMLLSHTAGFTHEAPVGNNNDLNPGTWETHIASISDSWLIFPVGQGYSYSNIGIDLAGHILEQQARMPFQHYLKTRLFEPLGMTHSTFDPEEIERQATRAIGQSGLYRQIPPIIPMMPAGGAFASANDLARYLQFHINQGSSSGKVLLDPQLIDLMYRPHFQASEANSYGLGLYYSQGRYDAKTLRHNGGGFGFMSQMLWYPDLKIGVAWLSNSQEDEHDLFGWLSKAILNDLIDTSPDLCAARANAHTSTIPAAPSSTVMLSEAEFFERIQQSAIEPDEGQQERWEDYVGYYSFSKWGQVIFLVRVQSEENLVFNGYPVVEIEPGLFIAFDGEAIDFRGPIVTVSNNKLERDSGVLQAQNILLRLSGIGFVLAIVWNGAGLVRGIIRRRKEPGMRSPKLHWLEKSTNTTITLGSLLALVTISTLFKFPILLYSGVPLPQRGLPIDMQLGFSIIYTVFGLMLLSVGGVAFSWSAGLGTRLNRIWSSVFTGILVLFCLLVVV